MEGDEYPEDVQRAFYAQAGFSLWSVLDGTTHVSKLAEAQLPRYPLPAAAPPTGTGPILPRGEVENDVDETDILLGAKVVVAAPRPQAPTFAVRDGKNGGFSRQRGGWAAARGVGDSEKSKELVPAIAWTNFSEDIDEIESGKCCHSYYGSPTFDSRIGISEYRRADALMRASYLTKYPAVRKRYQEAAVALTTAKSVAVELEPEEYDSDDKYLAKPQPCALEKETRPYREWVSRALETKLVALDATPEQIATMNFYRSSVPDFSWPSVDELVEHTWTPPPFRVPQVLVRVPVNPEALSNDHAFAVQGIGNKRRPDFEVKAERDLRLAKRRAIERGLLSGKEGGFDNFGPTELGGMKPPEPPPSFEFSDMLKKPATGTAPFHKHLSIGPASGMHLFVYDELVPPLRAVSGMSTTTSLFYQKKSAGGKVPKAVACYKKFPFTKNYEFAGPHDSGPLFAPIEKTPQAIMDNDHMRAYIAPVHSEETTDFVVRMKDGKIIEIVPVHSRVAVGQVFPKHRKTKIKKEVENIFFNRALSKLFPAEDGGMGKPVNVDRLLQVRPKLMAKNAALAYLKKFTTFVGPKLVSYNYSLGIPNLKPECTYTAALETALVRYHAVQEQACVTRRAIDPLGTVGTLKGYLSGKGLLLRGGKGASDPGAVNLSGLQTLKSGATQAKEDLEIFPEIVGGMYPLPREKDAKTGKAKKMREGSSSDTRTMTRAQYAQKLASLRETTKRDNSADSEFLDAKLKLLRTNCDTTSDRWEILRFLNAHDKSDPTSRMNQNTLRRFSMTQVCKESCRQTVHAFHELVRTGVASLDTLPPARKFERELRTREPVDPPFLERFTIKVLYRGGREQIFSEGGNSQAAWALKTFYTARKISFYHKLERNFSNKLFQKTRDDPDLREEIVEIQDLRRALEEELLAGLPITDAFAKQLLSRAKNGTL